MSDARDRPEIVAMTAGLTDEQRVAVAARGVDVALSAGAGSGKTRVLTTRLVLHLCEPRPRGAGRVAALTFTKKAAREILARLRKYARDPRLIAFDPLQPTRARQIRRRLDAAHIDTIHGFCDDILRQYADEAGIDPDFEQLDADQAGVIRAEALDAWFYDRLGDRDEDLIELAASHGVTKLRETLDVLVEGGRAAAYHAWSQREPADIERLWRAHWDDCGPNGLWTRVRPMIEACLDVLREDVASDPKMVARRAWLLDELPRYLHARPDKDAIEGIIANAKIIGANPKTWVSAEVRGDVGKTFESLRKAVSDYDKTLVALDLPLDAVIDQSRRLARLAASARRAYDVAKRVRGALDFNDLIAETHALTRDRSGDVARSTTRLFQHLLVDEFQDTDVDQNEILAALATPELGKGRLFLVGDPKQSIYRFRGARPELFESIRASLPEAGRLALTMNFRAAPPLIDFVNALFATVFREPEAALTSGIAWRAPDVSRSEERPRVVLATLETGEITDTAATGASRGLPTKRATTLRRREAQGLATWLRKRLDEGWTVRDPATDGERSARPGDIAFLFRAMSNVDLYERALEQEGFSCHTVGGRQFYDQQEIIDLINVLSAVDDPFDEPALAGALRGPFFRLSDEALYRLSSCARAAGASWIEALDNLESDAELSEADRFRAGRARTLLSRWRAARDRDSTARLLGRVLDESGYEAAISVDPRGGRMRANVRKLSRVARRFDAHGGFNLSDFTARLRQLAREPDREEQAALDDEAGDTVRLLSIHQSKGLEFPIVIVPDLNRPPAGSNRESMAVFDRDLGLVLRSTGDEDADPTSTEAAKNIAWAAREAVRKQAEREEALRLFYVATTRARDGLVLSMGMEPALKTPSPAAELLTSRFSLIDGSFLGESLEGRPTPRVEINRLDRGNQARPPDRRASAPRLNATLLASEIESALT